MYQLEQLLEEDVGASESLRIHSLAVCRLDSLEVPRAVVIPEELVNRHQGIGDPKLGIVVFHLCDYLVKPITEPLDCHFVDIALLKRFINFPTLYETEGVPYLVAEIPALLHLGFVIEYVVSGRRAQEHAYSDSIGAIFLDEIERVRTVSESLAHFPAYLVPHDTCEVYVAERNVLHELISRHYHPRHPEEYDVRTGHEVIGRIIICQVGVRPVLRMARHLRVEH